MINPHSLRQLIDEAKSRYYDFADDDDISSFCEVLEEVAEDEYGEE